MYGKNGQRSMVAPVVYVPCNNMDTISSLPRSAPESLTIPLLFKRRKSDKSTVYEDAIRPKKVIRALKWLYRNSELWRTTTLDDEKLKGLEGMKRMDEFLKIVLTASGHNDR